MAGTLMTRVLAALCFTCSDQILANTTGPHTFNLNDITGTWWTYLREGIDGPYHSLEMKITGKTPEEIAVYRQSWHLSNNSQNETYQAFPLDSINWDNVSFYGETKSEKLSTKCLIESLADSSRIRTINRDGRIQLFRVKFADGKLTFREVNGVGVEFNFYRTLPDLETYGRCENFENFDASDAFDDDSLVGTWTAGTRVRGFLFTLRVTRKTAEEISAYRAELRSLIQEVHIDWTKVRLEVELLNTDNDFKVLGLIENLDKLGSIRVIPLKETWDRLGTREVENWFTSQNLLIKKEDGFLAVRNCDNPWQRGYFSKSI